jgi:hypothetical protein
MRAWFRKGGGKDDVIPEEEEMLAGPHNVGIPTGYGYDPTPPLPPGQYWYDPRRPMQYPAPRVEELYISEQERDLYLAALTSLETPTPNLVLCNSPAPQLPLVVPSTPLVTPKIEYPTTPQPPEHGSARPTPRTATRHAILTLVGDAGLRFTGFPGNAVVAATEAVRAAWAFGVSGRSGDIADIDGQEPIVYRLELKGKAWNRKSTKELE